MTSYFLQLVCEPSISSVIDPAYIIRRIRLHVRAYG